MGGKVSIPSPVLPEGLGCVIYDQNGVYGNRDQIIAGSVHSQKGGKGVNQDAAILCQGFGSEDGVFCGVFDGHGKFGHVVSKIVRQRLPVLLLDEKIAVAPADTESDDDSTQGGLSSSEKKFFDWEEACVKTFEEMDKELKHTKKADFSFSGTTAVVVLKQAQDFFIANLGDSRAVLGTKTENGVTPLQLTTDLKPGTPDEADRIRKSNGRVFALREEPGVERAWLPRIQCPGIAMSRCFGDFVMKKHGLISTPVVTHHSITSDDLFIVLATDGVWDVLSNEEVISIVTKVEKEEMAAQALVDAALVAWKTKLPYGKPDDCTALCLFLQNKDQTQSTTPQSSLSR
uniref:Protein phosphatase-2C n=1 Tax=Mesembryanthemum crystallinum TaxID=3544 RepID=O82470_MESCR|nr:protein phosphatase-2C [Mesembryanthemum crystallinum]